MLLAGGRQHLRYIIPHVVTL